MTASWPNNKPYREQRSPKFFVTGTVTKFLREQMHGYMRTNKGEEAIFFLDTLQAVGRESVEVGDLMRCTARRHERGLVIRRIFKLNGIELKTIGRGNG